MAPTITARRLVSWRQVIIPSNPLSMRSQATPPPLMRTPLHSHTTYNLERHRNQVSSQLSTMTTVRHNIPNLMWTRLSMILHQNIPNLIPFQLNMILRYSIPSLIPFQVNMILHLRVLFPMLSRLNMILRLKISSLIPFQLNTIPVSQMISLMTPRSSSRASGSFGGTSGDPGTYCSASAVVVVYIILFCSFKLAAACRRRFRR